MDDCKRQVVIINPSFTKRACRLVGFFVLSAMLSGCALILPQTSALQKNPPLISPANIELESVPFFAQEKYQCGPAALAMVLNSAGVKVTPEELVDQVYLPSRKGSLQVDMLSATRRNGLLAYELAPQLQDLLLEISAGHPVIVLENYSFGLWPVWHYAVAIGYNLKEEEIIRRSGTHFAEILPFSAFEYIWKTDGYWSMVALPLDQIPASATETRYANAILAIEKSGHTKNAHIAYNTLLKRWPKSLAGLMGIGNTAVKLKDLEGAKSAFLIATQEHPQAVEAFNNLAYVFSELGETEKAIISAENAVALGGPLLEKSKETLLEIRQKIK
jgi:tetratricopeptide (TPR) repeat protein